MTDNDTPEKRFRELPDYDQMRQVFDTAEDAHRRAYPAASAALDSALANAATMEPLMEWKLPPSPVKVAPPIDTRVTRDVFRQYLWLDQSDDLEDELKEACEPFAAQAMIDTGGCERYGFSTDIKELLTFSGVGDFLIGASVDEKQTLLDWFDALEGQNAVLFAKEHSAGFMALTNASLGLIRPAGEPISSAEPKGVVPYFDEAMQRIAQSVQPAGSSPPIITAVNPAPPIDAADAAVELWMLLDIIDTLDDACKDDDAAFRNKVRDIQRRRFDILPAELVDAHHRRASGT